jgi:hypothetical protein
MGGWRRAAGFGRREAGVGRPGAARQGRRGQVGAGGQVRAAGGRRKRKKRKKNIFVDPIFRCHFIVCFYSASETSAHKHVYRHL